MKQLLVLILLILLIPSIVYGLTIIGSAINKSPNLSIVTTTAATSITGTSATLNGTAYNYNSAGTTYFNYGLTSSYGTQTSSVTFAANTSTTAFSANVTGLTTSSTYHFQACVNNNVGIVCGSDLTFSTTVLTRLATLIPTYGFGQAYGHKIDATNRNGYISTVNGGNYYLYKYNLDTMTATTSLAVTNCHLNIALDIINQIAYIATTLIPSDCASNNFGGGGAGDSINITTMVDISQMGPVAGAGNLSSFTAIGYGGGEVWMMGKDTANSIANMNLWQAPFIIETGYNHTPSGSNTASFYGLGWDGSNSSSLYIINRGDKNIVRYNLSGGAVTTSPSFVDSNAGGQLSVDNTNGFAYFATDLNLYKLDIPGMTTLTQFILPSGVTNICDTGIDIGKGYIYYMTDTNPIIVGAINLSNFSNAGTLTLNTGEAYCHGLNNSFAPVQALQVDTINHVLYVTTGRSNELGNVSVIVKIQS